MEDKKGQTERDYRCLSRSHSVPSLRQTASPENETITRAQSLPDLLLKSSFEEFTPDITVHTDPTDSDHDTSEVSVSVPPPSSRSFSTSAHRKRKSKSHSLKSEKKHKKDSFSPGSSSDYPVDMLGHLQDDTREVEPHSAAGPSNLQLPSSDDEDSDSAGIYGKRARTDWMSGYDEDTTSVLRAASSGGGGYFPTTPSQTQGQTLHPPDIKDTDDGGPSFDSSSSTFSMPTCSQSTAPTVPQHPRRRETVLVLKDSTVRPEGSKAQDVFELLPLQSESDSGGDSYTLKMSTQPTHSHLQIPSSDPGSSKRDSRCLSRSHSVPSLRQSASPENKTFTRAQSLPDLLLKSSFEEFTPDITVHTDPTDSDHDTSKVSVAPPSSQSFSTSARRKRKSDLVFGTASSTDYISDDDSNSADFYGKKARMGQMSGYDEDKIRLLKFPRSGGARPLSRGARPFPASGGAGYFPATPPSGGARPSSGGASPFPAQGGAGYFPATPPCGGARPSSGGAGHFPASGGAGYFPDTPSGGAGPSMWRFSSTQAQDQTLHAPDRKDTDDGSPSFDSSSSTFNIPTCSQSTVPAVLNCSRRTKAFKMSAVCTEGSKAQDAFELLPVDMSGHKQDDAREMIPYSAAVQPDSSDDSDTDFCEGDGEMDQLSDILLKDFECGGCFPTTPSQAQDQTLHPPDRKDTDDGDPSFDSSSSAFNIPTGSQSTAPPGSKAQDPLRFHGGVGEMGWLSGYDEDIVSRFGSLSGSSGYFPTTSSQAQDQTLHPPDRKDTDDGGPSFDSSSSAFNIPTSYQSAALTFFSPPCPQDRPLVPQDSTVCTEGSKAQDPLRFYGGVGEMGWLSGYGEDMLWMTRPAGGSGYFPTTPSQAQDQTLHPPDRKDTDDGGPSFDSSSSTFNIPTGSQSIALTAPQRRRRGRGGLARKKSNVYTEGSKAQDPLRFYGGVGEMGWLSGYGEDMLRMSSLSGCSVFFPTTSSQAQDQTLHPPDRKDTDDGGPSFDSSSSTFTSLDCSQSIAPTLFSPPCPQNRPVVPQDSTVCAEGSGAQEDDAVMEVETSDTALNYSVTNNQSTHSHLQLSSSNPGWTERDFSGLSHSHSVPSLSQELKDFTPEISVDEDDETYRFQCSCPGLYQCSVTGLVFHMEAEGDVVYKTVPWDRRLLAQHNKQPAGPLFDIKCLQQSVCQLHLPHCEIRSTGGCEFLSVAHVNDESIEFIVPQKITETHVIINITGFSGFGNVKDKDSPPDPVRALVLLFYRPPADPDPESLLNVLLLPVNIVLRDVVRTRKKLVGDEIYIETSPHCKLCPKQEYTLSTCPEDDSVLVQPTEAEFDCDNYDNYFPSFQVILEKIMKRIKLFLRDTNKHSVWERRVCLSSNGVKKPCTQDSSSERLLDIRSSFVSRISEPGLNSLLDKLLEKTTVTDSEMEAAYKIQNHRDKARFVIDTVRKKGEAASSEMMKFLCELDPFLCEHLDICG